MQRAIFGTLLLAAAVLLSLSGCASNDRLVISSTELENDAIPKEELPPKPLLGAKPPTPLDLPSCPEYCERVMKACHGAHAAYPSHDECLGSCRSAAWSAEDRKFQTQNSLSCRLHWAVAAAQDPRRCQAAGMISPACDPTLGPAAQAPPISSDPRCALGLYDSTDGGAWPAGRRAREVILKDRVKRALGGAHTLRLHDVNTGLPSAEAVRDCSVIVSVFYDGTMLGAVDYLRWLAANIDIGRQVVIINDLGAYQDKQTGGWITHGEINRVLDKLGVRYDGKWTNRRSELSVLAWDSTLFRRKPKPEHYYRFMVSKPDVTVHMSIGRDGLTPGGSAVVFSSPRGGMVLTRYYEGKHGFEYLKLRTFLQRTLTL